MVASRYGHLSGKDLIKLTHSEDPWRDLSESDEDTGDPRAVITHDALSAFFAEDHPLTPLVRDRVAAVSAGGDSPHAWIQTRPGELDDLEARYAKP